MTTKPHDRFAKQFLQELLSPLGEVLVGNEVTDEARFVDVLFSPTPTSITQAQTLGLLGKVATQNTALLEPYRNQPSRPQIRNCIAKIFILIADVEREAQREKRRIREQDLPHLWILAPSISKGILKTFKATLDLENWMSGVYFLPDGLRAAVVAINQLPVTPETLWFRLLGRGKVQRQAVEELVALPAEDLVRRNVLEIIYRWRISVMAQPELTQDERELIMNLTQAYEEARAQAVQEGVQQGQRQVVENLLRVRFGSVDEELSRVVDSLLLLSPEEFANVLLQLTNLSREELLARFAH
ncbi:hypothetical protein NOS3756_55960 (plasmid) [Nostoc sp. NIES-3756]|uniref:hypothetical protein n=1 Tax=Nostoc sp. NIES-3756 TaxID=1751286 RepID=UPI0007222A76|nr:hypothetical protein [Nostoc sp. NIES-3756]BAT56584.1 hypothetical protein NOS3756_55960 [Nostoc sp. NIES-3756]